MNYILTPTGWRSLSESAGDTPWRDLSDETKYHPGSSKKIKGPHGDEYEISAARRKERPGEKHVRGFRRVTLTGTTTGDHKRLLAAFHQDGWIHDGEEPDGSIRLKHPTRKHTAHVQQTGPNKSRFIVFGGFNIAQDHNHVHGMMDTMADTLTRKP